MSDKELAQVMVVCAQCEKRGSHVGCVFRTVRPRCVQDVKEMDFKCATCLSL